MTKNNEKISKEWRSLLILTIIVFSIALMTCVGLELYNRIYWDGLTKLGLYPNNYLTLLQAVFLFFFQFSVYIFLCKYLLYLGDKAIRNTIKSMIIVLVPNSLFFISATILLGHLIYEYHPINWSRYYEVQYLLEQILGKWLPTSLVFCTTLLVFTRIGKQIRNIKKNSNKKDTRDAVPSPQI
jgi:hypothetical protein